MVQPVLGKNPLIHSFKISAKEEGSFNPSFNIFLELHKGVKLSEEEKEKIGKEYSERILNYLIDINFDFKDAYNIHKDTLTPKIKIYPFLEGPFQGEKQRIKTKIII
ncbi:MAG TPA: hypothetical protein PLQ72_00005 [Candidatus Pacearchaeota archaeon]|nr:hypothetical protein [Candidatus Pacearchaeota archaeon]